jgi:rhodanese-related sulfurtransferase
MPLPSIDPVSAKRLLDEGAILVDIREADEHAREKIPRARLLPLSRLDEMDLAVQTGKPVVFHCKSGARTLGNAARLAAKAGGACEAFIVAGGLEAWKAAGLPVTTDRSQPLELQRQVQIGAGALALLGTLLGLMFSPWFLAIPLFVGAGLLTAGVTGFCGMATLLLYAPWNKPSYGR